MPTPTLPVVPPPRTAIPINNRFAVSAEGKLRVVFLEGQPVMEFHQADPAGRDLVMVQLCEHGGLGEDQVARAFDVSRATVSRAKRRYDRGGVEGLLPGKRGPKGPTRIKEDKEKLMISMARAGIGKTEIATRLGVNESAVRKALRRLGLEELAVRQSRLVAEELAEAVGRGESEIAPVVVQHDPEVAPAADEEECKTAVAEEGNTEHDNTSTIADEETKGAGAWEEKAADLELPVATSLDTNPEDRSMDRALAL